MPQIRRRADSSEIMYYNDPQVPFYVDADSHIENFPNREMLAHWHEDIEFIQPLEGQMAYYVNDREILLTAGNALLINSRQLHHARAVGSGNCTYLAILFRPEMLCNNILLRSRYIDPVANANLPCLLLEGDDPICACMKTAARLYTQRAPAFELRVMGQLNQMWALLYEYIQTKGGLDAVPEADPDVDVQKQMADYIHRNYSHKVTLTEVAQAGGVCKSKCCQIFKKYLRKSPGEFLMAYRLEAAAHLLRTTSQSVTEIAYACGFNSPSYFTEAFRRENGCTPRSFRQRAGGRLPRL